MPDRAGPPPTPEIRRLRAADLPRIVALERRVFPTPWSLAMFVLELAKPSGVPLGAFDGDTGELVGYLICARYDQAWHLMNIAVAPEARRRGIARHLIDALLDEVGHDADVTLEVRVSNAPAITLYESYGFRGVGHRPRYYSDTGEDAIIMWRAIGMPWETA